MRIKNGLLLNEHFEFEPAEIVFEEKILAVGKELSGDPVIDAKGGYVLPGFVDIHMHAAVGRAFMEDDAEAVRQICSFEASRGTTTLVPAVEGASQEIMERQIQLVAKEAERSVKDQARILGIYLEGPFFSKTYRGGFPEACLRNPDQQEMQRLCEAGNGWVRMVSMAPELEGALPMIEALTGQGIAVSLGHTAATCEEAKMGFAAGASCVTHMFNAMSPMKHREPGMAGAAMITSGVSCELIADLFHVHPDVIRILYRLKGKDEIILISDAERGTGMPDGEYTDNGVHVIVKDGKTYTEDHVIYGSTITLLDAVRNLYSLGIPLNEAVKMASINPAAAAGAASQVGSLTCGKYADILILNQKLELETVIVGGNVLK